MKTEMYMKDFEWEMAVHRCQHCQTMIVYTVMTAAYLTSLSRHKRVLSSFFSHLSSGEFCILCRQQRYYGTLSSFRGVFTICLALLSECVHCTFNIAHLHYVKSDFPNVKNLHFSIIRIVFNVNILRNKELSYSMSKKSYNFSYKTTHDIGARVAFSLVNSECSRCMALNVNPQPPSATECTEISATTVDIVFH